MLLLDRITIEPGKRGGKPCIRGTRMSVQDVLEYLASGMSIDRILEDFPFLTKEDILNYEKNRNKFKELHEWYNYSYIVSNLAKPRKKHKKPNTGFIPDDAEF